MKITSGDGDWVGTLATTVHEQIRWVSTEEMMDYTFCPADVEIVEKLVNGVKVG